MLEQGFLSASSGIERVVGRRKLLAFALLINVVPIAKLFLFDTQCQIINICVYVPTFVSPPYPTTLHY